jgi:hypothetical protein
MNAKCVQNTNRKPIATYRLVMSIPLGGATKGHFRFRYDLRRTKIDLTRKRLELQDRNVSNTKRKQIAAYRLVMSIPLGGTRKALFRFKSDFATLIIDYKSYTARVRGAQCIKH